MQPQGPGPGVRDSASVSQTFKVCSARGTKGLCGSSGRMRKPSLLAVTRGDRQGRSRCVFRSSPPQSPLPSREQHPN